MEQYDIFDEDDTFEYNLTGLPELVNATNATTIIERIDVAASRATVYMRAQGVTLPGDHRVPSINVVDGHLRGLVNRAVRDYFHMAEHQRTEGKVMTSVEGVVSDDMFEVVVTPHKRGALHVHISMLLV